MTRASRAGRTQTRPLLGAMDRDTGARNRHNAPYWVATRAVRGSSWCEQRLFTPPAVNRSPLAPCGASPSSSRLRACARSGGTTSMRRAPRAAWSRCSTPPRRPVGSCTSSRSAAACRTASLSHPSSARPSQTPPTRRRCSSSFAAGSARVSSSSLPEAAGRPPRPAVSCVRAARPLPAGRVLDMSR